MNCEKKKKDNELIKGTGLESLEFTNCTHTYVSEDKSMQLCCRKFQFYVHIYCK